MDHGVEAETHVHRALPDPGQSDAIHLDIADFVVAQPLLGGLEHLS
jgi:hypothetical protein